MTLYDKCLEILNERGVDLNALAVILQEIQSPYHPNLTIEECHHHILRVLEKREVQNAILTGVALDVLAEENKLPRPLQEIIASDEPLYGIDEILALSITNIYGSIGFTNFGYLDKIKPGIIGDLDRHANGQVHTFLDDLCSAIVAAAASRLAHSKGAKNYDC